METVSICIFSIALIFFIFLTLVLQSNQTQEFEFAICTASEDNEIQEVINLCKDFNGSFVGAKQLISILPKTNKCIVAIQQVLGDYQIIVLTPVKSYVR